MISAVSWSSTTITSATTAMIAIPRANGEMRLMSPSCRREPPSAAASSVAPANQSSRARGSDGA